VSALVITQRSRITRNMHFVPCENGCQPNKGAGAGDRGRSSATHVAWIIGRHVLLCGRCARNWQRWWDEAQDPAGAPKVLAA
jgi:hypothetical protein